MSTVSPVSLTIETISYDITHPFGYSGGTFPKNEVQEALANHRPLTLDFSIPGICFNKCSYCGYYEVNSAGKLSLTSVLDAIVQFAVLGGRSVKILGEGEPLLRIDIRQILATISQYGLIPVLFTCGDVLGDEQLCNHLHRIGCQELCQHLYDLGCTLVLKFESWQQDDIVGRPGYSKLRNRALRHLLDIGFNKTFPTRLGFGTVLLKSNYDQLPEIYRYALHHNIYPLICPLMPIGRSRSKAWRDTIAPTQAATCVMTKQLIAIRNLYSANIYDTSDFPGGLPCDVARCGMYVDDVGNAFLCESDECVGNLTSQSIRSLWNAVDLRKSEKYGVIRSLGLCMPKRQAGILTEASLCDGS